MLVLLMSNTPDLAVIAASLQHIGSVKSSTFSTAFIAVSIPRSGFSSLTLVDCLPTLTVMRS
jgi:hypothetical protein